jgi:hypothetical protein
MYSITKRTASQNIKCTLHKHYKTFCNCNVLWRCTLCDVYVLKIYVLELLSCVQLCFVKLRHVTFTLCCFTLCSNITVRPQSQFLHSCFCERFIYSHHRSVYFAAGKYVDRSWEYINRSQTHECVTWDWGSAIPFLGKYKWDFRCSAKSQSIPDVYQSYDDEIICTKTTETFRLFF